MMKMDYCVFGTNDKDAAIKFYDALFEETDLNQVLSNERMTFWQSDNFAFAIAIPFNGESASHGNGTMIGFNVGSTEAVKRFHEKVIALGGTCEGEPSQRGPMFSAYARDLDKNKIAFYV